MIDAQPPEQLIKEHNEISDFLAQQAKAFNAYCKQYNDRLAEISNLLLAKLIALNEGKPEGKRASLSTDAGTAYLSTIVTPKTSDKEAFLDFCLGDWDKYGAMLQIGAPKKDEVVAYMDENGGHLPPTVEISSFTRVNIRRS